MKTISKEQFEELVKGLNSYFPHTYDFSSSASLKEMEESIRKYADFILYCDLDSLINEGEFIDCGCAESTSVTDFEEGKKYRVMVGDPMILTVEVIGMREDGYLIFKTERGNFLCTRINFNNGIFFVEILEELEF